MLCHSDISASLKQWGNYGDLLIQACDLVRPLPRLFDLLPRLLFLLLQQRDAVGQQLRVELGALSGFLGGGE